MKKVEFEKLKLEERLNQLKVAGDFIGSRKTDLYRIHLFSYSGLFIEVHVYIPLNQVQWIEVQTNKSILEEYIIDVGLEDLKDKF